MNFRVFYDGYHKGVKLQKRVIDENNFTYRHIVAVINKYLKAKSVLDIGSGVGTIDFYLASKGKIVTGIEISKKAVNAARRSAKLLGLKENIRFIQKDIFNHKSENQYRQIICSEVLEHLKNDKKAVKKIYGLLKKGGMVIITVPSRNAPLLRLGLAGRFDKISGHLRRYTLKELKSLLQSNNFKIIYSQKTEGVLRNSLFVFRLGSPVVRVANKFGLVSDIITFFDNLTVQIFGESQLIVVAKK